MTKTYCDNCEKEITDCEGSRWGITLTFAGRMHAATIILENGTLCSDCWPKVISDAPDTTT